MRRGREGRKKGEKEKRRKVAREERREREGKRCLPGSFHPPGPACLNHWLLMSRLLSMLCQLSWISPVVRQLFPTY